TVKIWDAATGECLQTLEGHRGSVRSVVFSHNSRQLASASDDLTVKIWDAATGECLQMVEIGSSLSQIAFDPNDSYLLTEVGPITLRQSSSVLQTFSKSGDADAVPSTPTAVFTTASGVKSPQGSQQTRKYDYGLSSDRSWIVWHDRNVLWL